MDQLASCTQQKEGGSEGTSTLNKVEDEAQHPRLSSDLFGKAMVYIPCIIYTNMQLNVDKDRRKPESSCIKNRNIKWCNLCGKDSLA